MVSLLQLQYFLTLSEEGHLTRAAEKLYVSQSTLSTMIARLERELEVELFDRKNNRLVLNRYGEEYREYISIALNAIEMGERRIKSLDCSNNDRISVAVTNALIWHDLIWQFKKDHPDVHIQVYSDKMDEYSQLMDEDKLDFIIAGAEDFDSHQCDSVMLSEKRLRLCVAPEHPLAERESITIKDIGNYPYVELSPGLPYRNFCDSLFKRANFKPNIVIECNYEMRPKLVLAGYGVAITTGGYQTLRIFSGCKAIPIEDDIAFRRVHLFWRKNRKFTPIMQDFYNAVLNRHEKFENLSETIGN